MTDDITPEMRRFPHRKFLIMALLDTLYNMLSAFPTPHIGYAICYCLYLRDSSLTGFCFSLVAICPMCSTN